MRVEDLKHRLSERVIVGDIGDPPGFLIGVAVNPAADDPRREADRLRRKIDNGAHFAMSQVCFDWQAWDRFAELFGGELPVPTLAALWRLLEPQEIGISLTDGMMMEPEASVSALVFHHPAARYFSVSGTR